MKHTGSNRACPGCNDIEGCRYRIGTPEMNRLQNANVISDNCIHWEDVAEADQRAALAFLFPVKKP